jgi:nitrate reductase gamma subunit
MNPWLEWARGPAFIFCFGFMLLGLAWHVGVTAWEIARTLRRAGDPMLPLAAIGRATLKWLLPVDKFKDEAIFTATSVLFHVAILIVPIFLAGHIELWARGIGLSWPAIPNEVADVLTIVGVATAVGLVVLRASARATRALTKPLDYALPLLLALPLATGLMVMHPSLNPFSYDSVLFVHVMSGNLVFLLMPTTKLAHAVLLPGTQLVSEVGWRWPLDSGSKVAAALGKEAEPV